LHGRDQSAALILHLFQLPCPWGNSP